MIHVAHEPALRVVVADDTYLVRQALEQILSTVGGIEVVGSAGDRQVAGPDQAGGREAHQLDLHEAAAREPRRCQPAGQGSTRVPRRRRQRASGLSLPYVAAVAGIRAATQVPASGSLCTMKLPPVASTRSRSPWSPSSSCSTAPPTPS